jgi:CRP-like cAMP-binding protein
MLSSEQLKRYKYFSGLSAEAIEALRTSLDSVEIEAGKRIIRQGTPPDYFYFLARGEVELCRRTTFGQSAPLSVLSSGETFGEIALLTCSHRTCSVTTKTPSLLYRLAKKDFDDIVVKDAAFRHVLEHKMAGYAAYDRIKSFQPFALLEPEQVLALTETLVEKHFAPGETIVHQGDQRDFFYVIKTGRVAVLKEHPGAEPDQVAELGEGEGFGEEAILREQKRGATVQALDPTTVLALSEPDFRRVLGAKFIDYVYGEDLLQEGASGYVFIDARVPAEYQDEHIEGAINLPLEILRRQYAALDPEQPYVTYCTNDSRGTTAAFLLSAQGFQAKALRGGIGAWDGPVATGPSAGLHLPSID